MTRWWVGASVVLALCAGLALRVTRLDVRPMHHDEANQAVKFGALLERGEYRYDPQDHHGPTLYYLALPAAWMRGQPTLASLDERTLRAVPVAFGAAIIVLPLLLRSGIGSVASVTAAWLLALSPAMVFYSRMFIQESLFAFFTLAFAIALGRAALGGGIAWPIAAGVAAGMAIATKETSILVLPVAVAACVLSWRSLGPARTTPPLGLRGRLPAALAIAAIAAAVAGLFYSAFLTAPGEVFAPLRGAGTYLSRGLGGANHQHPWHFYLGLLTYSSSGGLWWSEGIVIALAAAGALAAWRTPSPSSLERAFWSRYLASYAILAAAVFSAIPYKTPWNLVPFYAAAIVLAGLGCAALLRAIGSRGLRAATAAVLVILSGHLGWQAWRAAVPYASDARNPYVYSQTVPDLVRMATRIRGLAAVHAAHAGMQVSVIASPYEQWPMPWYLRAMPHVGYWEAPGDPLALQAPAIVSSMDHVAALDAALGDRYVSEFYGLRPEVLLTLYVERSLWDRFLASASGYDRSAAPAVAAKESTR